MLLNPDFYLHTVLTVLIDDPPADRGFAAAAASGLSRGWLAAGCWLRSVLLRRSMDQLGGSSMRMILDLSGRCAGSFVDSPAPTTPRAPR
jgi:hypothetical protein